MCIFFFNFPDLIQRRLRLKILILVKQQSSKPKSVRIIHIHFSQRLFLNSKKKKKT